MDSYYKFFNTQKKKLELQAAFTFSLPGSFTSLSK